MQPINGTVKDILITTSGEKLSHPIPEGVFTWEGLTGDCHTSLTLETHGRQPEYPRGTKIINQRQISLLSEEELGATAKELGIEKVDITWLAGNLLVSGIENFSTLPFGSRMIFAGEVVLVCGGENLPCSQPAKVTQAQYPHIVDVARNFVKAAMHRRGMIAWVEHPGVMHRGETFRIELPQPWSPFWVEYLNG